MKTKKSRCRTQGQLGGRRARAAPRGAACGLQQAACCARRREKSGVLQTPVGPWVPRVPGGRGADGGMQASGMAGPCEVVSVRPRLGLSPGSEAQRCCCCECDGDCDLPVLRSRGPRCSWALNQQGHRLLRKAAGGGGFQSWCRGLSQAPGLHPFEAGWVRVPE